MAKKAKKVKRRGEKLPTGITIRGNRYRVRVQCDMVQHDCGSFDTKELAELALRKYQAEVILGTFIPPAERRRHQKALRAQREANALTVAQWSGLWLEQLETVQPPRSPSTIASYRSSITSHVLPIIGGKRLDEVTPADIDRCIAKADDGGKHPSAAKNVLRYTKSMFNAAVAAEAGGLTKSPVTATVSKAKARARQDDEVPSLEEVLALSAAMPADTALAVDLAAWCSLRLGEVLGLQRGDFRNLDKPGKATVTIERQWLSKANPPAYGPPKDDSHRTVAIPAKLAERIQEHLDQHTAPYEDAPLFPSPRDPARTISHNAFSARWNVARAKVRPGTDFHALRHFGLTLYAQMGATQTELMRRGGHRDAEAAQRYQHSSAERDQEIAARLNDRMEGQWG